MPQLELQDEWPHQPTQALLWRESYYFNFHDTEGKMGGLTAISVWPNRNLIEGITALMLGPRRTLLYVGHAPTTGDHSLFSFQGIRYNMSAPGQRWQLHTEGLFVPLDPQQGEGAVVGEPLPVQVDLTWQAITPLYDYAPQMLTPILGASRHYEQAGQVQGTVRIDGADTPLVGYGARDHSWGVRDWVRPKGWWVTMVQFGPQLTLNAFLGAADEGPVFDGFVYHEGHVHPVEQITVDEQSPTFPPRGARVEVVAADGLHLTLEATVLASLPVFFERGAACLRMDGTLARFRWGTLTGYGMLERGVRLSDGP